MEITFDWSALQAAVGSLVAPASLEGVAEAMQGGAVDLANTWEGAASGIKLPGMTRTVNDPVYAASIDYRQFGVLEMEVGSKDPGRDAKAQDYVEPWDMKYPLTHGPKSRATLPRRNNPVHRFNIIPIRHQAASVSQDALWALLANLRNFQPRDMPRMAKFTPAGVYVHKAALEAGIRMGRGGPVTFRTVSEKSPAASWWYPAKSANPIAEAVWDLLGDAIEAGVLAGWIAALGLEEE